MTGCRSRGFPQTISASVHTGKPSFVFIDVAGAYSVQCNKQHNAVRTTSLMKILKSKKNFLWLKIVGVGMWITLLGIASYFLFFQRLRNRQTETYIDRKFHQEAAQIPQIKVTSFKLWEGDSLVQADIENKGSVRFWYGRDGVLRIESVSTYTTFYDCFFINNGQKTGYAFSTNLVLNKESKFKKWFPFEVNNLKDLVEKYDAIVTILRIFPQKGVMTTLEDRSGKRPILKQSNPDYVLTQQYNGKNVVCDLFQ